MIRIILKTVAEGAIKLFSGTGRAGESFAAREVFQHYGFSSAAPKGAEGIAIRAGNNIVLIAEDDRRYRLKIKNGEVALYTDEGDHVHLKRGRVVEVVTETLVIKAGTKVRIESPQVEATGEIIDWCDSDGRSMEQMRITYDSHTHQQVQPGIGNSGVPNQGM
ncbi:phage baseplate assembly protein [Desulfobulbus sp.]|uniref:phage baseplate assembly protein domain-containing protein n=1 Tax=Desulfobulbus sp. TaxID=895 RepID=UPI00286F79D6|nr:phage baseplate assembly protein [Desulfobulbus sp.]